MREDEPGTSHSAWHCAEVSDGPQSDATPLSQQVGAAEDAAGLSNSSQRLTFVELWDIGVLQVYSPV